MYYWIETKSCIYKTILHKFVCSFTLEIEDLFQYSSFISLVCYSHYRFFSDVNYVTECYNLLFYVFRLHLNIFASLDTHDDLYQAGKGGELTHHETTIIAGALELAEKKAGDAMTPMSDTFCIDINSKLDR